MLSPEFLKSAFDAGKTYDDYVRTGTPEQQAAWKKFHERVTPTEPQRATLAGFVRRVNVLVSSGVWCGDCVQQVPMLDHIERAAAGKLIVRYVDRDEQSELAERVKICGGLRVPVALTLNEDFDFLSLIGDRSLTRYRSMAARQLGPSCPLPGAPVPDDEVAATLADWVNEIERAHLICRTSTKLRQRHED